MNIKRKAYNKLLEWKTSSSGSKAIMVQGARRVGKSYLCEKFAGAEYRSYILIDFSSPLPGTLKIFEEYGNRFRLTDFFNQLSVLYSTPLYKHKSVLIFDEVQKYPKARELVKHIVADGKYDVIETGSLISIKKNTKDIIIPSEEEQLNLYPLDFEEFLGALSDDITVPYLRQCYDAGKPLGNLLKPVMEKFRLYMIIGGMPQAVAEYVNSGNIDRVERIKRTILKLYREDIAKYAENYVAEATAVFNAIPSALSHHDKKTKFSSLSAGDRFSNYEDAIYWIGDSMVGNLCYGTDEPCAFGNFNLQPNKVKCYMGDTGLLLTLAAGENYLNSELYKSFMMGKLSVNQGMMTENVVAQMLRARGKDLRFYEKIETQSNKTHKYEVDFLISDGSKTVPIEVKSGSSRNHPSLDYYCEHFDLSANKGILLTKGDLKICGSYEFLPLPMALFL